MNVKPLISALALSMTFAAAASAQDFSVDLSYMSKYVWRGAVLDENAVFQPSLTGGMGNLSVNLWGNMNLDTENSPRHLNEWDYTVDYSASFDKIGVSAGIIGYTFPNTGLLGTTELYVGASYDVICSPAVKVFQDIEGVDGTYVSLSGGYSVPVGELTAIDLGAAIGYGSGEMNQMLYSAAAGAGLADVLVNVGATFPITELFSVTPSIIFTSILNSDGQDAYDAADKDYTNILFGLTASASF
jgi:hypothetical protein